MWVVLRYYLTFLLQVALVCTYEVLRISYEKRLFKEKEFARSLLGHYNEVKDLYESLSILHHDLKYHLKITDELLQSGKAKEAGQYLAAVKSQIPEENMHYYCLNHAVNALLSSYAKRCKELDIKYDVNVIMPEMLSVPDYDICTVLGNLLENAFEACQKLKKGGEIKLTIKTDDSRLAIMAKNTFDGVVSEKNGKLSSTKKGGGLGLPGIKAIVDSHDGHMLTEWDKTTFTAYLILNVESES
jgi:sensor histidine kinase regulating citrate/malate metabolism